MLDDSYIAANSKRSAIIVLLGAVFVISSMVFSAYNLEKLSKTVNLKKKEISNLSAETNQLKEKLTEVLANVEDAQRTQQSIFDSLIEIINKENVNIIDSTIDWENIKEELLHLPQGSRKNVLLNSILLTWKPIPFSMGDESTSQGFDSPRFLRYVLKTVDINIADQPRKKLSDTIMSKFEKTENPQPGDLVFFKGQVGSFGFILLSIGQNESEHIGIGTLQQSAPLQIIKMDKINTPVFPLIGYYKVEYN